MSAVAILPYEKQLNSESSRMCGAACLSMVYRKLGMCVSQSNIWPAIAQPNSSGTLSSTTYLMARDALNRGFSAVAIQARHPLQALRVCHDLGIHAVLNHRLDRASPAGHYSVLVDIDDEYVLLHDPLLGPERRLSHAELLELWQPRQSASEIAGSVLIAIAPPTSGPTKCQRCHTALPEQVDCPRCNKPVGLQPTALLGCLNDACPDRMWNYLCCSACDYTWTFKLKPLPKETLPERPVNLDAVYAAIDKFYSQIRTLPAAASPEIKHQLDLLVASKQKLKLAREEELAHLAARQRQLTALAEASREKEQAHRRNLAEINTETPPLNADALGRALLKNLGFSRP